MQPRLRESEAGACAVRMEARQFPELYQAQEQRCQQREESGAVVAVAECRTAVYICAAWGGRLPASGGTMSFWSNYPFGAISTSPCTGNEPSSWCGILRTRAPCRHPVLRLAGLNRSAVAQQQAEHGTIAGALDGRNENLRNQAKNQLPPAGFEPARPEARSDFRQTQCLKLPPWTRLGHGGAKW